MRSTGQTPAHHFTLTGGQLTFLRYLIERGFIELLEHTRDAAQPPDDFVRINVDLFVELCEIFGVEVPEVPEK